MLWDFYGIPNMAAMDPKALHTNRLHNSISNMVPPDTSSEASVLLEELLRISVG